MAFGHLFIRRHTVLVASMIYGIGGWVGEGGGGGIYLL